MTFQFPHRSHQYHALEQSLSKDHMNTKLINIFGRSQTGKTFITLHALERMQLPFSYINCQSSAVTTFATLFETIRGDLHIALDTSKHLSTKTQPPAFSVSMCHDNSSSSSPPSSSLSHHNPISTIQSKHYLTDGTQFVVVLDQVDLLTESWYKTIDDELAPKPYSTISTNQQKLFMGTIVAGTGGLETVTTARSSSTSILNSTVQVGLPTSSLIPPNAGQPTQNSSLTACSTSTLLSESTGLGIETLLSNIYRSFDMAGVNGAIILITQHNNAQFQSFSFDSILGSAPQYIQFLPYTPQQRFDILVSSIIPPNCLYIADHIFRQESDYHPSLARIQLTFSQIFQPTVLAIGKTNSNPIEYPYPSQLDHITQNITPLGLLNQNISTTFNIAILMETITQRLAQLNPFELDSRFVTNSTTQTKIGIMVQKPLTNSLLETFTRMKLDHCGYFCTQNTCLSPLASATHFSQNYPPTPDRLYLPLHNTYSIGDEGGPMRSPGGDGSELITIPILQILPLSHCLKIIRDESTSARSSHLSLPSLYAQIFFRLVIASFYTLVQSMIHLVCCVHYGMVDIPSIIQWVNSQTGHHTISTNDKCLDLINHPHPHTINPSTKFRSDFTHLNHHHHYNPHHQSTNDQIYKSNQRDDDNDDNDNDDNHHHPSKRQCIAQQFDQFNDMNTINTPPFDQFAHLTNNIIMTADELADSLVGDFQSDYFLFGDDSHHDNNNNNSNNNNGNDDCNDDDNSINSHYQLPSCINEGCCPHGLINYSHYFYLMWSKILSSEETIEIGTQPQHQHYHDDPEAVERYGLIHTQFSELYSPMYIIPPGYLKIGENTPPNNPNNNNNNNNNNNDNNNTVTVSSFEELSKLTSGSHLNESESNGTGALIPLSTRLLTEIGKVKLLLLCTDLQPLYVSYILNLVLPSHTTTTTTTSGAPISLTDNSVILYNPILTQKVIGVYQNSFFRTGDSSNINQQNVMSSPYHHLSHLHYAILIASFLASHIPSRDDNKAFELYNQEQHRKKIRKRRHLQLHLLGHTDHSLEGLSPIYARYAPHDRLMEIIKYVSLNAGNLSSYFHVLSSLEIKNNLQWLKISTNTNTTTSTSISSLSSPHNPNLTQCDIIEISNSYKFYNIDSIYAIIAELISFQLLMCTTNQLGSPYGEPTYSSIIEGYKSPLTTNDIVFMSEEIGFYFGDLLPYMTTNQH